MSFVSDKDFNELMFNYKEKEALQKELQNNECSQVFYDKVIEKINSDILKCEQTLEHKLMTHNTAVLNMNQWGSDITLDHHFPVLNPEQIQY